MARPCPVCESSRSEMAFSAAAIKLKPGDAEDRYTYLECVSCGSYFIEDLPTDAVLASYYESGGYHTQGHDDGSVPLSAVRRVFYDSIHGLDAADGRRLLDFGCGPGLFLEYAREKGWDAEGVEFSDAAADAARARGFKTHTVDSIDAIPDDSYDVVVMIHVLEHLPDPRAAMAFVSRVLRPGGRFLVELPCLHTWEFSLFGTAHGGIQAPIHLQFFSDKGLEQMAEEVGLRMNLATNNPLNTLLLLSALNLGPARDKTTWATRVRWNVASIPLVLPLNLVQKALGVPTSMRVYRFERPQR